MRIGVSTNGAEFIRRYGDNAYRKIRELGFETVDFNGFANTESEYYTLPGAQSDALIVRHRELSVEAGVEISQTHGPWRWPPLDGTAEGRAERLDKMKRSVRMTKLIGARYMVVHPIMPFGVDDIGTGNEEATWELNHSFMSELTETAREYDVTVCLENMPMLNFSMATPEKILEFVKEINDRHFMICFDTGHAQVFGSRGMKLGEETRRLGSYLKCLHIHDSKQERDLHLFPTFGAADWGDFVKALADIDYSGTFNLETFPPSQLSDKLFEDAARLLHGIAKELLG